MDRKLMEDSFKNLGFEVRHHQNFTLAKIRKTLDRLSLEDHSNRDILAVVILTHGKEGLLYSYDSQNPTQLIWEGSLEKIVIH